MKPWRAIYSGDYSLRVRTLFSSYHLILCYDENIYYSHSKFTAVVFDTVHEGLHIMKQSKSCKYDEY